MAVTTNPPVTETGPGTDTRQRLVTAAAKLVHAESYQAAGVKAICAAARVRRGSFYHFFESKQALMLEALDYVWERYLTDGLDGCRDGSQSPRDRIESMLTKAADKQRQYRNATGHVLGCTFGNLAAEAATLDDAIRSRLADIFEAWAAIVAEPLAAAQEAGEIDSCVDALVAARDVVAGLQGLLLLAKVANDPDVVVRGGEVIVSHLWGCEEHAT